MTEDRKSSRCETNYRALGQGWRKCRNLGKYSDPHGKRICSRHRDALAREIARKNPAISWYVGWLFSEEDQ